MLSISSLLLTNFKRFKVSNIKEFDLDIKNKIQCIIGTNGSGKSSVLNQLKPNTPIKSDFDKKGIRTLELDYDTDKYILTSDFSHSNKAHSFIKNNEELNIGGGANIQQELIESYLKISPIIVKILSCDIDICNMTPSKRKQLLLSLNPIDISLFVEYHQKIKKELNKIKNNLSMLYTRKNKLKEQKISYNELSELNNQRQRYQTEKSQCTNLIIKIQTILENIPKPGTNENIEIKDVYDLIRSYVKLNQNYSNIDSLINNLNIKLAQINESIDHENINIDKLITEIEEYQNHLKHTTQIEKIEIIDSTLIKTISDLAELKGIKNNTNLDIFILAKLYNIKEEIIQKIIDWINIFREYEYKDILSKEKINSLRTKINQREAVVSSLSNEISILDIETTKLSERISQVNIVNIPKDCKKQVCSLYQQYDSELNSTNKSYQLKTNERHTKSNELAKLRESLDKLNAKLDNQEKLQLLLVKLNDILNDFPYLKQLLKPIDLKNILSNEPFLLIKEIKEIFINIENLIKKESLEQNKDDLIKELNVLKSSTKISSDFIRKKLEKDTIEYNQKFKLITELTRNRSELESRLNKYLKFLEISEKIHNTKTTLSSLIQDIEYDKSKEFYQIFLDEVITYANQIDTKLQSINHIIKSQEFIIERLKKEILAPIKTLSKSKVGLLLLETALKEISLEYIKDFLDKIIELSNFFLSRILTYSVVMKPIKQDEIDFIFPIVINDVHISDINNISSGQKDMVKLSFNLALLILLNKTMHPLFIDEIDKTLDEVHKLKLINLFTYLLDENIISQLFLINHHVILQEGFNGDVIVLDKDNITIPEKYNENLKIKK